MRTNIVIEEALLEAAMRAGPFKTKKEAVEAGLKLLARKAAYRDILALHGKLRWDDIPQAAALSAREPQPGYSAEPVAVPESTLKSRRK
ncbi:type II toxin-antitoxin system VapB family antitoxin [Methylibium sp.]|uniref:type II toxin-antitoxin system VapB family antitoxin n=1 Tax=Methylibium sp. TaxID=2067992 RepID=UPI001828F1A1|nr:type II toxin-antitoxin system VapB family antitoxin [Methylibium sp.]MBA3588043.1 type II toxin-antitoxin system VapB family antitoxin [Methylibium sp.]